MKPILSIVIPVYNVSEYVEKCIRSCYSHTLKQYQYEIIIVNDGSTDNSLEICENLKKEFTSLKIINQLNQGLSGARNTGLKKASGDYIWFVDSDDWIQENCLPSIIENIEKFHTDIIWIGHDVILNGDVINEFIPRNISKPISGEDFFDSILNNLFYIWKFIYKKDFLLKNSLEFHEGILYEDLEFTPRALLKAESCITLSNVYYHYLMREGSIVNNVTQKNINDRFYILNKLFSIVDDKTVSKTFKNNIMDVITHTFIGSVKMSARAKVLLPQNAFKIIKQIKQNRNKLTKNRFDFVLMKFNLIVYYKIYLTVYKLYKTF